MNEVMKQYNKLSDKEKIRRLEWIAQSYAGWLNCVNWKESPFVDSTKYWHNFEESLKEK